MIIKLLCCHEILEIFVFSLYFNWTHCSLQKVSPFLQYIDNCQHLLIVYFIVLLNWRQGLAEKCNQIPFVINLWLLRENSFYCEVWVICFYMKRFYKDFTSSKKTSIGTEVTAFFRTSNDSYYLSSQVQVLDDLMRSKRRWAIIEKS